MARAPWPITTIVSTCRSWSWAWGPHWPTCCALTPPDIGRPPGPPDQPHSQPLACSPDRPRGDQAGPDQARSSDSDGGLSDPRCSPREPVVDVRTTMSELRETGPRTDQARLIARRLAAAGRPISRRALRDAGVKGSNELLSALACKLGAELANEKMSFPRKLRPGSVVASCTACRPGPDALPAGRGPVQGRVRRRHAAPAPAQSADPRRRDRRVHADTDGQVGTRVGRVVAGQVRGRRPRRWPDGSSRTTRHVGGRS